jgi:hypothetical protein
VPGLTLDVVEIVDSLDRLNATSVDSVAVMLYSVPVLLYSAVAVKVVERVVELDLELGLGLVVDSSVSSVRVEVVLYVYQLLLRYMEADVVKLIAIVPI